MTHEDSRRTLTSIPYLDGEIKIIVVKQDCELGNHYHKVKTETFQLLAGRGVTLIDDKRVVLDVRSIIRIYPGQMHSFHLDKDSILFCICSHPYDKSDDYEY